MERLFGQGGQGAVCHNSAGNAGHGADAGAIMGRTGARRANPQSVDGRLAPTRDVGLGREVEFVIHDLRLSGPLAFASVSPQRPGGGAIDPTRTPAYQRGELNLEFMDGLAIQALYFKSGNTWVAVHWEMGATDAWYAYAPLCAGDRRIV